MEFYIKQNATLPVLKMQVVKDGRAGFLQLMEDLAVSTIFFTIDKPRPIPSLPGCALLPWTKRLNNFAPSTLERDLPGLITSIRA